MSDNVKDELAKVVGLADAVSWSLADDLAEAALAFLAERGFLVLGPDGEPIDVRPALRALGRMAWEMVVHHRDATAEQLRGAALTHLWAWGVTGPLADTCLAAAEEPVGSKIEWTDETWEKTPNEVLEDHEIPKPLADACLAAVEVEPIVKVTQIDGDAMRDVLAIVDGPAIKGVRIDAAAEVEP